MMMMVRCRVRPACLLLTGAIGLSSAAPAYRSDHGFLPAGSSACDEHPAVTLVVPPNARPIPDPFLGQFSGGFFHVEEIADGLFYATDGVYQSMFLVTPAGIVLVDAPPSIGQNPLDPESSVGFVDVIYSIPETRGKPIRLLIYSHSHIDHIGAAGAVREAFPRVRIVAHHETARRLRRPAGPREPFLPGLGSLPPPPPDRVFFRSTTVGLGGERLRLSSRGPIHEPGNIFVYAPRQKVLMLVDVVFPGWSPFNRLALAEDVPSYLAGHDEILSFDFDFFLGGHLNRIGTRNDVEDAKLYLEDLRANAEAALAEPALGAIFGIVPENPLGAFHIFLDQVACRCAVLTLDETTTPSGIAWIERLGAADINTLTHCWVIAEALRIDPTF